MRLQFVTIPLLTMLAACAADPAINEPDPPIVVRTAEVQPANGAETIIAAGTVRLREEADLGFTTAGRIAAVLVNEGDRVRKGQLLATLDTTTVGADLRAASAERNRAAAELKRTRELFAKGWVTLARVDDAEAAYRAAAAGTDSASFAARTARILAPDDGVVLARMAEPTQVVAAGTPVIGFGGMRGGYVMQAPLTDRQAAGLESGAAAEVSIPALGPRPIASRIVEVAGRADVATGTFMVEVALPSLAALKSGQIGEVRLERRRTDAAGGVVVPSRALFAARAGEAFVYVLDPQSGTVKPRKVVPGETADSGTIVLQGLAAGEIVATTRIADLREGLKVAPVSAEGA